MGEHPSPAGLDVGRDRSQAVDAARGEDDVGAGFGERHGEPRAEAGGRAGDDGDLVVESETIQNGHGDSPTPLVRAGSLVARTSLKIGICFHSAIGAEPAASGTLTDGSASPVRWM